LSAHIGWDDKGTHLLRWLAGAVTVPPDPGGRKRVSLASDPVSDHVSYELRDRVAVLSVDDGKANALSFDVLGALDEGLDRAESDGAGAVLVAGRSGMFSGGFDLAVMRGGDPKATLGLVTTGAELVLRCYRSPRPIVAACTGHAIAAGAFLLMGAHARVGAEGAFRICLIETQIGMVLPDWAVELTKERLVGPHAQQAAIESRVYDPAAAVEAGFLDRVVPEADVLSAAFAEAQRLAALPAAAYAGNAAKVRAAGIERLEAAVARDREAVAAL
jgi:enoyl-CoA hydratase